MQRLSDWLRCGWRFVIIALAPMALAGCSEEEQSVEPLARIGNVHGLFVGIDKYQYSRAQDPNAAFSDLQGAVGDVDRFKAALRQIYGLDVDRKSDGKCESANSISTTLIDNCATRVRILGALDAQIDTLEAGDTLLFYFAGHGSRYRDDEAFDQDSGYNGTILPHDARNPDGSPGDIFDVELKQRKDRATAKGLYFVTIFDSCNSGTATRDVAAGQSRSVPTLDGGAPMLDQQMGEVGAQGGYWTHFAAAQDGEDAQETMSGEVGERAGVFTTALIETLREPGMASASFGDIISEVQIRVAQNGATSQTPSAEGRLTASLGATSREVVLFDATAEGGTVTLLAGSSSGITEGSTFAFYELQADALAGEAPLAAGYVKSVGPGSAQVLLDNQPDGPLPERLQAEKTAHFFPPRLVVVSNAVPAGSERDGIERALADMAFVTMGEGGVARLELNADRGVALLSSDGKVLVNDLGRADAPDFAPKLKRELQKLAHVQQLLNLRTELGQDGANVQVCIAPSGYRPTNCPQLDRGGARQLEVNSRSTATLINRGPKPRYLYLLAIDPYNSVQLVLPVDGERDRAIAPGQPYSREFGFDQLGNHRFVTIVSDTPIRADAFVQSASGSRDITACSSPLERLLCKASEGTRDISVKRVGDWSASITTAIVVAPASGAS